MVEISGKYKIGTRRFGLVNWIGAWTLYKKEVLRFLIVWIQTLFSPLITSLLFLSVLSLAIGKETTKDDLNNYLRSMAFHSDYREIIGFVNSSEVVSTDFYSSPFASIIDSQATIASGKRITLYCWYDNEYGYSKQVTNLAKKIAGVNLTRLPKPIEKNI